MQQQKINKIFLEVRESNLPARKLYEGVGFKKMGIRKNYYQTENAVNYELRMTNDEL
jgi:ribosomal-protein-alanine N-acetyltransferase